MTARVARTKVLHCGNGRQKPEPHNIERDIVQIRSIWYDEGIRMRGLLRRFEQFGWTRETIEAVVYYRDNPSLQDGDIERQTDEDVS